MLLHLKQSLCFSEALYDSPWLPCVFVWCVSFGGGSAAALSCHQICLYLPYFIYCSWLARFLNHPSSAASNFIFTSHYMVISSGQNFILSYMRNGLEWQCQLKQNLQHTHPFYQKRGRRQCEWWHFSSSRYTFATL